MIQWLKDQWEEWLCGFILGAGFFWLLGLWCLLLGLATGILWRLGGRGWLGTKAWRRIGISLILSISLLHHLSYLAILFSGLLTWGVLSVGYSQRSTQPPDPGTWLGNITLDLFGAKAGKWVARGVIIGSIWAVWGLAYAIH